MMSIQESSEFDLVALGASALIELALGAPLEIAEDKPDPKAFVVVEEIKPVGPASILPTPRPDRTTSQAKASPPSPSSASAAKKEPAGVAPGAEMHVVLPRRKAGELDTPEREAVVVTPEVLASLFQHPLAVASQKLGLSATTIKKLCRKLGINKWPYKSPFRTARSGCSAAAPASGPSNNRGGKRSRQESNADEDSDRTPSPVESALASPSSSCEASGPTEPAEEGEGRRTDIALLLAEATTSLVAHGGSSKRSRN